MATLRGPTDAELVRFFDSVWMVLRYVIEAPFRWSQLLPPPPVEGEIAHVVARRFVREQSTVDRVRFSLVTRSQLAAELVPAVVPPIGLTLILLGILPGVSAWLALLVGLAFFAGFFWWLAHPRQGAIVMETGRLLWQEDTSGARQEVPLDQVVRVEATPAALQILLADGTTRAVFPGVHRSVLQWLAVHLQATLDQRWAAGARSLEPDQPPEALQALLRQHRTS